MMPVRFSEDDMAAETKRRAPTWDDVRAAYAEGWADGFVSPDAYGLDADYSKRKARTWHPDNPANRVTDPEWRTDAPEIGRWVKHREGIQVLIVDIDHAEQWCDIALKYPDTYAWRYIDPPTDTTSEDNS